MNYKTRFIKESNIEELMNLWRLSKVHSNSTYDRMIYVSKWFHKEHPEVSETGIYKDLECLIANN